MATAAATAALMKWTWWSRRVDHCALAAGISRVAKVCAKINVKQQTPDDQTTPTPLGPTPWGPFPSKSSWSVHSFRNIPAGSCAAASALKRTCPKTIGYRLWKG